jgi:RNA polymerase sigma factor (sigma-70 family)
MSETVHPTPYRPHQPVDEITRDAERPRWARETRAALQNLSATQREVVQLVYFERLTQADTAARLGLSPLTVHATLASALQRIASAIEGTAPA